MASPEANPGRADAHSIRRGHLEPGLLLAGRYRLERRLGDGGHAEVWAARDERGDARVALKFLHLRSCSAEEALPVLRHEAAMVQRLEHPGVLRVEGPLRDGTFVFLPVEYAPGGDASRLRGAAWQEAVPVLLAVAEVLEHAHSRGVVHRDLKPGNVLFDAAGRVRLTDFGTAARTGCSDALADGSPFSASPQQLRGEPASTADDVYGLGALAYEMLTRYPPFYPHFDAQRMQCEDPPQPQPVQPAPAALLGIVQSMLARDAQDRPDLTRVMQVLREHAAIASGDGAGTVVIEAPVTRAAPARRPRLVGAGWWLGAAGAAAVLATLMWMPDPSVPAAIQVQAVATPAVTSVADAVVGTPAPAPEAAESLPPAEPRSLDAELRAGAAALEGGQPQLARAAFQRALALDPGNARASDGLGAAAQLETLLPDLAQAARAEAQGDLEAAVLQYQSLLARRPDFAPARAGVARVQQRQRDRAFEDLLAGGADALRQGRIGDATSAYERAAAIHPEEARVRDGQQRIAEVLRSQRNAEDLATGVRLESEERWDEALKHYQQVAARDATLRFAEDGVARSSRRAALDAELRDYLARPERLTAAAVRSAAERALARGEASARDAPRLTQQLRQLAGLLHSLDAEARVALSSDNSTEVIVPQLGNLGSFVTRELQLPPGRYTVIGRRDGFRDVRYELDIAPGQREAALSVRCTERI